jgi:hypothetical protein
VAKAAVAAGAAAVKAVWPAEEKAVALREAAEWAAAVGEAAERAAAAWEAAAWEAVAKDVEDVEEAVASAANTTEWPEDRSAAARWEEA